jgi:OOP family OmpA-OmpF porin
MKYSWVIKFLVAAALLAPQVAAWAQSVQTNQAEKPVVVTGVVPDEASKARLIARLRTLYGSRVVDQLAVGNVIAPPNWTANVEKILDEKLKNVSQGQISVDGTTVNIRGQIENEALRQKLVSNIASSLTSSYNVKDALTIMTSEQTDLNDTLAGRIIEFDSGSSNIRATSTGLLDEVAQRIAKLGSKTVEVIGHTDNEGNPNNNLILSRARAEAVKAYLVQKGIAAQRIVTNGMGDAQPVADNDTPDGRTRNRRIEFRIVN